MRPRDEISASIAVSQDVGLEGAIVSIPEDSLLACRSLRDAVRREVKWDRRGPITVVISRRRLVSTKLLSFILIWQSPRRLAEQTAEAVDADLVDCYLLWPRATDARLAFDLERPRAKIRWACRAGVMGRYRLAFVSQFFYAELVVRFSAVAVLLAPRNT